MGREQRRLTAVVSADVAGYTRLMGVDESGTLAALKAHEAELIEPAVAGHGGRIVKKMGDGLLIDFPSVVDAARCALAVQRGMAERNAGVPEARRIQYRIGINVGDIIIDGADIYGDGVNVAARVQTLAEPGGICVSRVVRDQVQDRLSVAFDDLGSHTVKNVARPVEVFRLREGTASGWRALVARLRLRRRALLGWAVSAAVAGAVVAVAWYMREGGPGSLPAARPTQLAMAVLPLENLSGDPEQEFLAEGLHEALITDLGQLGGRARVIGRGSVMRFKGTRTPLRQIAKELNVAALITGSVTRVGERVRVTAQLIDPATEVQRWAKSYERGMRDVLALQGEIVAAITREVGLELTPQVQARLGKARSVKPETYELYLRGMFHLNKETPEGYAKGLALLEEAIAKDPTEPLAYAGLALAYPLLYHGPSAPVPPKEGFPKARAAALKALELDPDNAQAHGALAAVNLYYDWDWAGAEREFKRALELNPSMAVVQAHYSWWLNLSGRIPENIDWAKRATETDPLSPLFTAWLGWSEWASGHPDAGVAWARRALDLDPVYPDGLYVLGGALADQGKFDEAIAAHRKLAATHPDWRFALAETYAKAGRKDEARAILEELEREDFPRHALFIEWVRVALGDKEEAFRALQAAYVYRHMFLPFTVNPPDQFPWRDDPRFVEMRRRMNFSG
jgi:adenylate cyclase